MVRRTPRRTHCHRRGAPLLHNYGQYFGDEADEFPLWPASPAAVEWEREQWALSINWNERHGARMAQPDYPGQSGIDAEGCQEPHPGRRAHPPEARWWVPASRRRGPAPRRTTGGVRAPARGTRGRRTAPAGRPDPVSKPARRVSVWRTAARPGSTRSAATGRTQRPRRGRRRRAARPPESATCQGGLPLEAGCARWPPTLRRTATGRRGGSGGRARHLTQTLHAPHGLLPEATRYVTPATHQAVVPTATGGHRHLRPPYSDAVQALSDHARRSRVVLPQAGLRA